ncbi:MAG: hypothetical protein KAH57_05500, partial [Thermoplasmata archaeon]|nr:hypothetical protein [Thermoplasmata archaeon]
EQGWVDEINHEISISPDSAGEMTISILVVDESGNSLIYNVTIFIEEEIESVDPNNSFSPPILIISAVLLLIILLITFFIWKRRRMTSDIGEGEPEE